jgi:hypothetical protein
MALARVAPALLLAAGFAGTVSTQQAPTQTRDARTTRDIFVSVVDRFERPVTGLVPEDFVVREDAAILPVVNAVPADERLHVVLLVDNSAAAGEAIADARQALVEFAGRLLGRATMSVVAIGEPPTVYVHPTDDVDTLTRGISRIHVRHASSFFLEGVSMAAQTLQSSDGRLRAIVAIATEGPDSSALDSDTVLERLDASRAALHVMGLARPQGRTFPTGPNAEEVRRRSIVWSQGTARTGGRWEQEVAPASLPRRLVTLADELLNQYVVTYRVRDPQPGPRRIQVAVRRPDITVRARTQPYGR